MARAKISQLDPKGADLSSTDLFEVSVNTGSGYDTYSITGQEIINGGSGVYVPYTGATQDVDLDANKLSAESIYIEGTNGAGHLHLKHQNADATATGQSTALFADVNGDIKYKNDNDYYTTLKTSLNTADRVYTFPNTDCTLVPNGAITTSGLTMATSRLLGRTTALNGAVEEISIGSGLTLSGGTLSSTGGGITVGTTAVTSGTDGRVFFQAGGVVQQDAAFFWDNTNKRLGVGATPSTSVRLDVRAQGALSTDIAFRVRNSADTFNLLSINGVGLISGRTDGAGGFNMNYQGTSNTTVQLGFQNTNPYLRVANSNAGGNAFNVYTSSDNREYLAGLIGKATLAIGANPLGGTIKPNEANTNTLYMFNGTAPTLSATNSFNLYSADITAGNAAPHFRTENGNIIKLYRETTAVAAATFVANTSLIVNDTATFDGYTIGQVVKALRNLGILA